MYRDMLSCLLYTNTDIFTHIFGHTIIRHVPLFPCVKVEYSCKTHLNPPDIRGFPWHNTKVPSDCYGAVADLLAGNSLGLVCLCTICYILLIFVIISMISKQAIHLFGESKYSHYGKTKWIRLRKKNGGTKVSKNCKLIIKKGYCLTPYTRCCRAEFTYPPDTVGIESNLSVKSAVRGQTYPRDVNKRT